MTNVLGREVPDIGQSSPQKAGRSRRWVRWLGDAVVALLLALMVASGVGVYYLERYQIVSGSMEPTLAVGDIHWAVRRYEPPRRGEVVSFHQTAPDGTVGEEILIKRVVGLPGERIEAVDGVVLIDFAPINESVWVDEVAYTDDFGPVVLGPDQYFLMGDNRSQSVDSRHFGPIGPDAIGYVVRR